MSTSPGFWFGLMIGSCAANIIYWGIINHDWWRAIGVSVIQIILLLLVWGGIVLFKH